MTKRLADIVLEEIHRSVTDPDQCPDYIQITKDLLGHIPRGLVIALHSEQDSKSAMSELPDAGFAELFHVSESEDGGKYTDQTTERKLYSKDGPIFSISPGKYMKGMMSGKIRPIVFYTLINDNDILCTTGEEEFERAWEKSGYNYFSLAVADCIDQEKNKLKNQNNSVKRELPEYQGLQDNSRDKDEKIFEENKDFEEDSTLSSEEEEELEQFLRRNQ